MKEVTWDTLHSTRTKDDCIEDAAKDLFKRQPALGTIAIMLGKENGELGWKVLDLILAIEKTVDDNSGT